MNVIDYPKAYQSAFRDACFVLGGVSAASGLDVEISSMSYAGVLGVKRVYAEGEVSVNAAPYVRCLLSPEPLCGNNMGLYTAPERSVACSVSAGGYVSQSVYLTAGSEDAPVNTIVSAAPSVSKIRSGETDEIPVISIGNRVMPVITFRHEGVEYTDYSQPYSAGAEMMTFVVNADAVGRLFTEHTGAPASEMTEFTVLMRIMVGSSDIYAFRRYEVDRNTNAGRRLAWINRYGAVDYYTFPYVTGGKASGSRERIYTPEGYRTVATASEITEMLLSEPCDPETAKWLSEIFSSPAVWTIDGTNYERVEAAAGSAEYSAERPGTVSVNIGPVKKAASRKS